ncbi:TPA: patatin family protein [Candidatus Poribacteria bacterium]|nr:patatin family protein [Candidatus Poribacteria bacterium]
MNILFDVYLEVVKINNEKKTALVLSSGAMMGSYQCGVLKAFRQHNLEFDVLIGSSAGAYNGIRYLSNQMDICERIYVDDLTNGRFFNKKNFLIPGKNFMDLNYLVDEVCRMESRVIDMDKVMRSKSEFYITAFELDTMTTRFFDAKKYDIFLLLKATAAIPYVYRDKVIIDGKRYIDGGMFEPIPIRKALELKCNKIFVVLNTALSQTNKRKSGFLNKLPGRIPKIMAEHNRIKHELNDFLYQKHEGIEIIVIRPKEPIPATRFTSDRDIIQTCVDIGYKDGLDFINTNRINIYE